MSVVAQSKRHFIHGLLGSPFDGISLIPLVINRAARRGWRISLSNSISDILYVRAASAMNRFWQLAAVLRLFVVVLKIAGLPLTQ
jgi:hypothetical protein